jgi:hypothetical protein
MLFVRDAGSENYTLMVVDDDGVCRFRLFAPGPFFTESRMIFLEAICAESFGCVTDHLRETRGPFLTRER